MTGLQTIEKCFEEAEQTGSLPLSSKGLRDFPDMAGDCELIDVIEAGILTNPAFLQTIYYISKIL